jgi:hypothetical protein
MRVGEVTPIRSVNGLRIAFAIACDLFAWARARSVSRSPDAAGGAGDDINISASPVDGNAQPLTLEPTAWRTHMGYVVTLDAGVPITNRQRWLPLVRRQSSRDPA